MTTPPSTSGNSLRANASFNFEADSSYDVRIRTTDAGGLCYEEAFTITVTNVNETPDANDDGATVAEEGSNTIDVLANDEDVDGDSLTITKCSSRTTAAWR